MSEMLDLVPSEDPVIDVPATVTPAHAVTVTAKDRAEAKKALKKSGLTELDLDKLEAKSNLGKFVSALGVWKLTATNWVLTAEDLESVFNKSVQLAGELTDPEAKLRLMQTQQALIKDRLTLIQIGFKAGEAQAQTDPSNQTHPQPFPANQIVTNIFNPPAPPADVK